MVAKDYPFYLSVKRANCSLEMPPASSPAKDAELRAGCSKTPRCCVLGPKCRRVLLRMCVDQ
ncbi:Rho guanine nucleotide exchange factor 3 [Myotis brandtii]|uniref:Rho guanine nucleotide exchange factor 3 n=1 Tax=Myotis brandtii TaxID=109478 RepID=S7MXA0_MYOBR|nr:Rho guanine nucleotide exchange factor 3 [Myotis brandtii]